MARRLVLVLVAEHRVAQAPATDSGFAGSLNSTVPLAEPSRAFHVPSVEKWPNEDLSCH